jgi:AP-4 complex subunit mu-1
MYRTNPSIGAHERTHTEAFFRKIKFWNEMSSSEKASAGAGNAAAGDGPDHDDGVKRDPPPVFIMPDGQSYLHVNRNGLIFACATAKNVSPCTVIEVSTITIYE